MNENLDNHHLMAFFQQLEPEAKPPIKIKKNLDGNLNLLRTIGSVMDLFIGKAGSTVIELSQTFDDKSNNKPKLLKNDDKKSK